MTKKVFIHFERCVGCRSCQLACSVAHSESKSLFHAVLAGEKPASRIFVHQSGKNKAPLNCRHCQDAPCIDACITGAMYRKEDGTVTNTGGEQSCTACWMCVMVCPYGTIRTDENGTMALKCDRECIDGRGVPACVSSCPTGALVYSEVDHYSKLRREEAINKTLS